MYLDNGLTPEEAKMLAGWDRPPSPEQYLANKEIYDNKLYYNQDTGEINWPPNNGFDAPPSEATLSPPMTIDRYGNPKDGYYFSPEGIPYGERSLAMHTDTNNYHQYEVLKPIEVKSGTAAPWFGHPGGGTQFCTEGMQIWDDVNKAWIPATIENLERLKYIVETT